MKKYEIYCNKNQEYFFVMNEKGYAFRVDCQHINEKARKVYIAAIPKLRDALKKADELSHEVSGKYGRVRGYVYSTCFEIDEDGVLMCSTASSVKKYQDRRESVGLLNTLLAMKDSSRYAKQLSTTCTYIVRENGLLQELEHPVVVVCTMDGVDVISLLSHLDSSLALLEKELTTVYKRAKIATDSCSKLEKIGSCKQAVRLFTNNKEFRERFESGKYGLITDGCPDLNGDKSFHYMFIKFYPDSQYRIATSCNWVFDQYAEYIKNFPGLSEKQYKKYLSQIPNQRSTLDLYLHNDTVRKLYNIVMSLRINGKGNYMMCYDKSTGGIMLVEEY